MPTGDIELPKDTVPLSANERDRRRAIDVLEQHLGGEADASQYGLARTPTKIHRALSPQPLYSTGGLVDDPQADLATVLMQRQRPELFKHVALVSTGDPQDPGIGGWVAPGSRGARISLGHSGGGGSGGNLLTALDTLRHELSHVAGLPDTGDPSAYDVSFASSDLHKDIRLPSQTGRVALPGKETKQTELEQWYVDRELDQKRRKIQNGTKK